MVMQELYHRRSTLSFGTMPNSRRPFPSFSAWAATSVYVCQVYSPKWSFVNTFPLSCFSSISPRICLVPKHFLSENVLLEYLKNLSIVLIFSGAFSSFSCKELVTGKNLGLKYLHLGFYRQRLDGDLVLRAVHYPCPWPLYQPSENWFKTWNPD